MIKNQITFILIVIALLSCDSGNHTRTYHLPKGKNKSFFEISENEIKVAKELGESYYIYQVTSALTDPKISTVISNLHGYQDQDKVLIEPMLYRVTFKE